MVTDKRTDSRFWAAVKAYRAGPEEAWCALEKAYKRVPKRPPPEPVKRCVHFIGLAKAEYWSALRVWGTPDFVHSRATWSCMGEIDALDTVVLGRGAFQTPKKYGVLLSAHNPSRRADD